MMLKKIAVRLSLLAALSACDAPLAGQSASSQAAPGPKLVTPAEAAQMFKAVCVDQRPSFRGSPGVLRARGFVPSLDGIYFDGRRELSFALVGQDCSVVFVTGSNFQAVQRAFAPYTSRVREVPTNGRTYYNARISG